MKKDIIEINWISADCIPLETLETLEESGCVLIKRATGEVVVGYLSYSDIFAKEYLDKTWVEYYTGITEFKELSNEEVADYLKKGEFVVYTRETYEEYGEYAGTGIFFIDDAEYFAIIPDNDVFNAIMNMTD